MPRLYARDQPITITDTVIRRALSTPARLALAERIRACAQVSVELEQELAASTDSPDYPGGQSVGIILSECNRISRGLPSDCQAAHAMIELERLHQQLVDLGVNFSIAQEISRRVLDPLGRPNRM